MVLVCRNVKGEAAIYRMEWVTSVQRSYARYLWLCPRRTCQMMVRPVDGPRTIVGKEGYRAENAPTAHLGPGVRRLARQWVHSRSEAPLEQGVERDGPTSGQYPGVRVPWASWPTFKSWLVPSPHLSPSVLSKKRLRDDDHKDEPTLDRTPATRGGSREVALTRRPNTSS